MSTHRNRRRLCWAALLPLLTLAVTGCHHRQAAVAPPPAATAPPIRPQQSAANIPPVRPGVTIPPSAGTIPGLPNAREPLQPAGEPISSETGIASWYGPGFTGRKVADGTLFDPNAMAAAHRTLPLGTIIRVTNLTNNEQEMLRINDRGPFGEGRILDLTPAAAKGIDMLRAGIVRVRVEAWPPPVGSDPIGKWCVQIGGFIDSADAIQLKNDLKQRYPSAKVAEYAGPDGHWVRIDPKNQDRATAEEIMDSIHLPDPSAQPYLIRLN